MIAVVLARSSGSSLSTSTGMPHNNCPSMACTAALGIDRENEGINQRRNNGKASAKLFVHLSQCSGRHSALDFHACSRARVLRSSECTICHYILYRRPSLPRQWKRHPKTFQTILGVVRMCAKQKKCAIPLQSWVHMTPTNVQALPTVID